MKLVNETDYPTEEVRKLVRYGARGLKLPKGLPVYVVPSRKHAHGYASQSSWTITWDWVEQGTYKERKKVVRRGIVIWLPPPSKFPTIKGWKRHRSGPMNHDWQTWQEALVALAAHEARHWDLWTTRTRHTSKQQVEMSCEAHEHYVLNKYRQENE